MTKPRKTDARYQAGVTKPRKKPTRATKPGRKLRRLPADAEKAELAESAAAREQLRTQPARAGALPADPGQLHTGLAGVEGCVDRGDVRAAVPEGLLHEPQILLVW